MTNSTQLSKRYFIRTVIEDQGGIHGDYIVTKVGDGAQGTVYKMESPDEQKVLKFFRTASSSLIEANSLIGLELNGRQIVDYEFKEIMSGLLSEPKPGTFPEFQDMKVVDQKGDFCVMSSFIRGVPLINHINAMQAIAYKLKATMRLVVQLLRQIQGIHFTLNRYALTEPGDRDIFGIIMIQMILMQYSLITV
ncbi:hypothetical protein SNEBB_010308 [Seison nebaliae]|nr:hypothetical protein SNEBB_010308 [Seison nebaliae]